MNANLALLVCLLLAVSPALAGPDHGDEHGHSAAPNVTGPVAPRLESAGTDLELVATAADHKLIIYLDRLATNEPVGGASIEVSGDGFETTIAEEVGEGTYEIAVPWSDKPGAHAMVFTVTADRSIDLLNGVLEVTAHEALSTDPEMSWIAVLAKPYTWGLVAIAALFGFFLSFAFRPLRAPPGMEMAATKEEARSTEEPSRTPLKQVGCVLAGAALLAATFPTNTRAHGGDDHAGEAPSSPMQGVDAPRRLPDGTVFVPKPSQRFLRVRTAVARPQAARKGREIIGTVVPDPSSFGQVQAPMDGRIELAERGISHVGQSVMAGEVLALLAPTIPVADLGTMQQLTAEVQGKLKIAEQQLARLTRIAGVVAQKDIEDTRTELEALREQKRVLEPKDAERIELKAPVSGVISVANVRAGQVVTARDTLFEIVDTNRLWVEAISSSEHDTADVVAAHATDADGHVIKLSYIGRAPALRQQSLLLQFEVVAPHEGLPIGSAVKVVVQHGKPVQGIVLPDSAVVRGANGLPQVWSKVSAEQFKALPVRTVPIDGAHVLVVAGVDEGTRVVTEGAELINQVR